MNIYEKHDLENSVKMKNIHKNYYKEIRYVEKHFGYKISIKLCGCFYMSIKFIHYSYFNCMKIIFFILNH